MGLVAAAAPVLAQSRQGFLEISGGAHSVYPSERTSEFWKDVGDFSGGLGFDIGAGFQGGVYAFGAHWSSDFPSIGGRSARSRSLGVFVQWLPGMSMRRWQPEASIGYDRVSFGNVEARESELQAAMLDPAGLGGNPGQAYETTMFGHAVRIQGGFSRRLMQRVRIHGSASVQAIRFGSVTFAGTEFDFDNAAVTWIPKLQVGLQLGTGGDR